MAIPIATTTITIKGKRPQSAVDPDADGYDAPSSSPTVLDTGVRASITNPSGNRYDKVNHSADNYTLRCDPVAVGLTEFDTIVDESTGYEYKVLTAQNSWPEQFGMEHVKASIQITSGVRNYAP